MASHPLVADYCLALPGEGNADVTVVELEKCNPLLMVSLSDL